MMPALSNGFLGTTAKNDSVYMNGKWFIFKNIDRVKFRMFARQNFKVFVYGVSIQYTNTEHT